MNIYPWLYRLGITPWEEASSYPPAADHINALFDREQEGRTPPFGRALDLGCGRGSWSVELARRGWTVTGVDLVSRAVRAARARAREAGFDVDFVRADITRLRAAGVEPAFRLFWDFGTIHGLTQAQRRTVGREVSALAADDATILMMAWSPGRRGPLPRGAGRADLEDAFAGWAITDADPFDATGLPPRLRKVNPHIYRFRRA
jgi:SAM-dependent methyltransferase